MRPLWSFITDFGDTAVTVPITAAVLLILLLYRRYGVALVWAASVIAVAGLIAASKIVLGHCGPLVAGLTSPSGHTGLSLIVYGGLALLLGREGSLLPRRLPLGAALAFAGAIAVSRIVLHYHTVSEVVVGAIIGLAVLSGLSLVLRRLAPGPIPKTPIVAAAVVLLALLHGQRWPAERAVHNSAGLLHWFLPRCG